MHNYIPLYLRWIWLEARSISVSTLILHGDDDLFTGESSIELHSLIPNSIIKVEGRIISSYQSLPCSAFYCVRTNKRASQDSCISFEIDFYQWGARCITHLVAHPSYPILYYTILSCVYVRVLQLNWIELNWTRIK